MSWLKDKLFRNKPKVSSFSHGISDDTGNSNAQYCQSQLKNFIAKGQELKSYVIGFEHQFEVLINFIKERYIVYKIAISALGQNYVVDRRYSEFKELHEYSLKHYPQYKFNNFPSRF